MKGETFNSELEKYESRKETKEKVKGVEDLKRWATRWAEEEAGAA